MDGLTPDDIVQRLESLWKGVARYPLTVRLSMAELSAVSRAAFVVTSPGEVGFINAADRGLRKLRDAAKQHADLPTECKAPR